MTVVVVPIVAPPPQSRVRLDFALVVLVWFRATPAFVLEVFAVLLEL